MYTLPVEELFQMTKIVSHEELLSKGLLVQFGASKGKAAFISHQWVGSDHPDPGFEQMRVLQNALKYILTDLQKIPLDIVSESLVPSARPLSTSALRSNPLFLWYDYFSCPQMDQDLTLGDLSKAIDSIPAYVASCAFFFALCPVVERPDQAELLSPYTWASRGWCRTEKCLRELSPVGSWIMVKSPYEIELVTSAVVSLGGAPGLGHFSRAEDKENLGPILRKAVQRKLTYLLAAQDFVSYRVLLNMQNVILEGFRVEPLWEPILALPHGKGEFDPVGTFLCQNGFTSVHEVDTRGWPPLHYAALRGDPSLLCSLLALRADLNQKAQKDNPKSGSARGQTAIMQSLFWRHNEAVRLLLAARAKIGGDDLATACAGNNHYGIRLLCEASCDPSSRSRLAFGLPAFHVAAQFGSLEAMNELAYQAGSSLELSHAICWALSFRGGSAELVQRLLSLRADIDEPFRQETLTPLGIYMKVLSLQYKMGGTSKNQKNCYHCPGITPVMLAVMSGQYEAAAVLIASGARLDLRNKRGFSVADFAHGPGPPEFLEQALQGQPEGCKRVAAMASSREEGVFSI